MPDRAVDSPNRSRFNERVDEALRRKAQTGEAFAVLIVDIDGLSAINEARGTAAGNAVIRETAQRLQPCLHEGDAVERIGDGVFGVLSWGCTDAAGASDALEAMVRALSFSLPIDGAEVPASASIGASLCPANGNDRRTLVDEAVWASFVSRCNGGNGYRLSTRGVEQVLYDSEWAL